MNALLQTDLLKNILVALRKPPSDEYTISIKDNETKV